MKLPQSPGGYETWLVDIEVFSNKFVAIFHDGDVWKMFEHHQIADMVKFLDDKNKVLVGYNNFSYDSIVLKFLCRCPGVSTQVIKQLNDAIIVPRNDKERDDVFKGKYSEAPWQYDIDVFQLLNGKGSLKEYQAKSGFDNVAETPVDFNKPCPESQWPEVIRYCTNDVKATKEALLANWDKVLLREELKNQFDLMPMVYAMSEQGVAQHTFLTLHRQRTGEKSAQVREKANSIDRHSSTEMLLSDIIFDSVTFNDASLHDLLTRFKAGKIVLDNEGSLKLNVDGFIGKFDYACVQFNLGVGGIHTNDKHLITQSDDTTMIVDLDVASYYPSLIIEGGLYPPQLGPGFVEDMRNVTTMRLRAKRNGEKRKADALKIVVNATYGKLNDKYSPLRSPIDAMRVTINGQLYLLMLVEALYTAGATILSCNTDGVTISWTRDKEAELADIIATWQSTTKMNLERADYKYIWRRDVNNYLIVTVDGKIKSKGCFNENGGKADGIIIKEAAEEYLVNGIEPCVTIGACNDIKKFLFYLKTKNGANMMYSEQELGKIVRWYISADKTQSIKRLNPATKCRKANVANVPNSEGAVLALDLSTINLNEHPIDKSTYEKMTWNLLQSIGIAKPCPSPRQSTTTTSEQSAEDFE